MGGRGAGGGKGTTYTGDVRYKAKVNADGSGSVTAYQDYVIYQSVTGSREVGSLVWNSAGKLHDVDVRPDRQRMGIGSEMWRRAQSASGGRIRHSPDRTDAGDRFARRVGGTAPPRSDWRG